MKIETRSMHITPVGGNVFADLGFKQEEALSLQAESKRIISEKLISKESAPARKYSIFSLADAKKI